MTSCADCIFWAAGHRRASSLGIFESKDRASAVIGECRGTMPTAGDKPWPVTTAGDYCGEWEGIEPS